MTYRTAFIYVNDVFAGELCETDYGYSFAYSKEYLHIDMHFPHGIIQQ